MSSNLKNFSICAEWLDCAHFLRVTKNAKMTLPGGLEEFGICSFSRRFIPTRVAMMALDVSVAAPTVKSVTIWMSYHEGRAWRLLMDIDEVASILCQFPNCETLHILVLHFHSQKLEMSARQANKKFTVKHGCLEKVVLMWSDDKALGWHSEKLTSTMKKLTIFANVSHWEKTLVIEKHGYGHFVSANY